MAEAENLQNLESAASTVDNGDSAGASLLSRTADDLKPDADNPEAKVASEKPAEDKADPSAKVPDTPEGYALEFAKGTEVDVLLLDNFRKTAKELGLTQGQAQTLASLYEANSKNQAEAFQKAQTKIMLDARKTWEAEIVSQPRFQEDLGLIQGALRQFGDKELYELLDQTNLGSHPKMFSFLAKVGRALAEPAFRGEQGAESKSAAEVLYPNMQ